MQGLKDDAESAAQIKVDTSLASAQAAAQVQAQKTAALDNGRQQLHSLLDAYYTLGAPPP